MCTRMETNTIETMPRSNARGKKGSKPVQFKFVEPYCVTPGGNHQFGFNAQPTHNDPFIINTPNATRTDPGVRKYIRSHVMRGKNKKGDGKKAPQDPASAKPESVGQSLEMDSFCLKHTSRSLGQDESLASSGRKHVSYSQWMPKPVGSDLSFVRFAEPMSPRKITTLVNWIQSIKQNIYPLSLCVDLEEFNPSIWIDYLSLDKAYVQCCIFASKALAEMQEHGTGGRFGRETTVHLNKTLKLLQGNLNDRKAATTDYNIAVVLILILMSCAVGDIAEVGQHLAGAKRMIKLRGGIDKLSSNPMLQLKACRSDLSYALEKGILPTLYSDNEVEAFWNKASIAYTIRAKHNNCPKVKSIRKHDEHIRQWRQRNSIHLPAGAAILTAIFDSIPAEHLPSINHLCRVTCLFDDLHEFCTAANLALRTGDKIKGALFKEALISTQYRLAHMEHQHEKGNSTDSTPLELSLIRTGMLAFATITFLHMEVFVFRYAGLVRKLQPCIYSISAGLPDLMHQHAEDPNNTTTLIKLRLTLWFLFIFHAATCRFEDHQDEDNDLLVGLVSNIFIALGLKSPNGMPKSRPLSLLSQYSHSSGQFPISSCSSDSYSFTDNDMDGTSSYNTSTTEHAEIYDNTAQTLHITYSSSPEPQQFTCPSPPPASTEFPSHQYTYPPPPSSPSSCSDEQSTTPQPHFDSRSTTPQPPYDYPPPPSHSPAIVSLVDMGIGRVLNLHQARTAAPSPSSTAPTLVFTPAPAAPSYRDSEPPFSEIWNILRDHMWIDWVHRERGKILVYKAFSLVA